MAQEDAETVEIWAEKEESYSPLSCSLFLTNGYGYLLVY